jgi:hypothetical protein
MTRFTSTSVRGSLAILRASLGSRVRPPRRGASAAVLCLMAVISCRQAAPARPVAEPYASTSALPLRVMTFNVRYDNPGDGPNAWPFRRDWVGALVRFHGADVVGVQEALAHMLTDLDARLPGFVRVGVGRTDGRDRGEFSAILYRTDRLELLDGGTFWLSPTPEAVGSKGRGRDSVTAAPGAVMCI